MNPPITTRPSHRRLIGKPKGQPRGRHAHKGEAKPAPAEPPAIPVNQRLAFRISEFAALLGVSTATIWRRVRAGEIAIVKQAGVSIIPRREAVRLGLID